MTNNDVKLQILAMTLESMREAGPRAIARSLQYFGEELESSHAIDVPRLLAEVRSLDMNNPFRLAVHNALIHWDYTTDAPWAGDSPPNTEERRAAIYKKLGLTDEQGAQLDRVVPHSSAEQPIIITADHEKWYTPERQRSCSFYWRAYQKYLAKKRWDGDALETLGETTKQVIERLSDPSQEKAFQSKGLVVGYVQSGKTANFAGVISRAADAGYRLIVVLTGQTEILRRQTQRRLDKELIGREQLDGEYESDNDFEKFTSHGSRPSLLGQFDWHRLTRFAYDYQSLKAGIESLEFEKRNPAVPFYSPENLRHARARLIVIKKNTKVLEKVIGDLGKIGKRGRLDEVPALIIDDESDEASLNVKPRGSQHSPINALINQLLKMLPRGQYVGYTATPFANVFVDPEDSADLFPKDFIIGLPRPPKYMGASDFYDFTALDESDPKSNKSAYVRSVKGADDAPENLTKAIDSFVLSGAIKLFRVKAGVELASPHHTMLIHLATAKAQHRQMLSKVTKLLLGSDYRTGDALKRLEALYEKDFSRVAAIKGRTLPAPPNFRSLGPFIGECLTKLSEGGAPVVMVNSEKDSTTPDFDKDTVWKVLVGGNKLSRGYTIEGLTISYYRRTAQTADTLMQMGRWFGFRDGYADLVRLFLGTEEVKSKKGETIDLYQAFGALCRDEEDFRSELKRYASMDDPRILPRQVPPLVSSYMLRPTARNKMFNARIIYENFSGRSSEKTLAPEKSSDIKLNWGAFENLMRSSELSRSSVGFSIDGAAEKYECIQGKLENAAVITFLKKYRWKDTVTPLQRDIEFLEGKGPKDPQIDHWLFLAPQQVAPGRWDILGRNYSVFERKRLDSGRIAVYSEPRHHVLAEYASLGRRKDKAAPQIEKLSKEARALFVPRQAVFLYYTVKAKSGSGTEFPAFVLFYPTNDIRTPIQFGVYDSANSNAVVVNAK